MPYARELGRLNVLLEFISDCAAALDEESLRRIAGGRLRWVLAFERCTLVVQRDGRARYWSATREEDAMREVTREAVPAEQLASIDEVLASRAPYAVSFPAHTLAGPLVAGDQWLGAVCFHAGGKDGYSFADLRYAQQVADHLASALLRIDYANIQRTSREKDEFFALLGHELRNPLAPIVSALHLLKARPGSPPAELDIIDRQAHHLVRLVDDLLDVARLTRTKLNLNRAPVDLSLVVRMALERAAPVLEERRHAVDIDLPDAPFIVYGDQTRLEQVVGNLLINAARYTDPDGRIVLSMRSHDGAALISVRDNGIGIRPEMLERVFDLFNQGERRALPHGQGGLGLGLPIARSLAEAHGGAVWAQSEGPGKGSVFTVRLPLMTQPSPTRTADPAGSTTAVPAQRILVVDDNQDAALTLAMVLRMEGHTVAVADGPRQAFEECARSLPDVAIIDIGMPVMNGYELAEAIRARFAKATPRLIAVTGYGRETDRERGLHAGFDDFLVKPVDVEQLREAISSPTASRLA